MNVRLRSVPRIGSSQDALELPAQPPPCRMRSSARKVGMNTQEVHGVQVRRQPRILMKLDGGGSGSRIRHQGAAVGREAAIPQARWSSLKE